MKGTKTYTNMKRAQMATVTRNCAARMAYTFCTNRWRMALFEKQLATSFGGRPASAWERLLLIASLRLSSRKGCSKRKGNGRFVLLEQTNYHR